MYDRQKLEQLRQALEKWEQTNLRRRWQPARAPGRVHHHLLRAGRAPVHARWISPRWITWQDLGLPGEYPYTRGVHPTLHRSKLWTMRMFAGFGTAEETNARFKYLLEQGQTGLSIAFDLPTLMGYDTDAPEALGEFGKCGVAVSSLKDMEILLDGIPLDKVSTSMTINSPGGHHLGHVHRRGRKTGRAPRSAARHHPE